MTTSPKPAIVPPTSNRGGDNTPSSKNSAPATSAALALSMAWQLLVVLVVPLVGGHLLDVRYHSSPLWMVVGAVVALGGTIAVVLQTVRQLNAINGTPDDKEDTH